MGTVESDEEWGTPPEIQENAANIIQELLPQKSKERYNLTYAKFTEWQTSRRIKSMSEEVMLTYFEELAQNLQASTLWSHYSMLKSTISLKHNLDIGKYRLLITYLKRKSSGFQSKKSKTLSSEDVKRFILEASDVEYLATKTALILGICGACRGCELTSVTTNDVKEHNGIFLVKIPDTKNQKPRSFTIEGDFYNIVKKFIALRPKEVDTNRFFLNYQHGKCTKQPIGKNRFASMPKQIAKYLQLDDAKSYTGHSFRRTSATLLADSGANITTIKRHGGWRSDAVAEGYIEDSVGNKRRIGKMITRSINLNSTEYDENTNQLGQAGKIRKIEASTSKIDTNNIDEERLEETLKANEKLPLSIVLSNCTNCTITFK